MADARLGLSAPLLPEVILHQVTSAIDQGQGVAVVAGILLRLRVLVFAVLDRRALLRSLRGIWVGLDPVHPEPNEDRGQGEQDNEHVDERAPT